MGEGERDIFWFCFPRAGVQVRSSSQFLHFVLDPAASPGSVGSSCPGGAAAFWGVWRCLLRAAGDPSVGVSSFISSPPPSRGILVPGCFLPLSHLSVAFLLGLVWCFSEHRLVCSIQRPPRRVLSPSPGCQGVSGCLCPISYSPRGGRSPVHPPDSARVQLLHGEAEGHAT